MSNLTLYEAADELRTLFDTLDGLEDPDEVAAFQKEMEPAFARALQKVENFVAFLRHLDSQIELCEGEIARIKGHQKRFEQIQESLENYAIRAMQSSGVKYLGAPTAKLRIQQNPPTVVVDNERNIPWQYKQVEIKMTEATWDAILEAVESGNRENLAGIVAQVAEANVGAKSQIMRREIGSSLKAGEEVPGARLERGVRLVVE